MAILHKYCSKCGANIKGAQGICPSCGKTLSEELLYQNIEQVGAGGIGYSDITDHESFKAYKKYTKKVQMIGFPLIAVFLIVVLIVMGTGPIAAVLAGIFTYILLLIIALLSGRKKPSWEGTVEKKRYFRRRRRDKADQDIYTVVFRTDSGKKKSQKWINNSVIYDYLRTHTTAENPLAISTSSGSYTVWYTTETSIPKPNGDYRVSGDNIAGYIITVRE